VRKIGLKRTAPVTTKAARGDDRLGVYSRRSYLSTAGDLFGLASVMALTLLVIPAITSRRTTTRRRLGRKTRR